MTDKYGNTVVQRRNDCTLGAFGAVTWFPQSEAESKIQQMAVYLTDMFVYSESCAEAASHFPSKIALAALIEAAADTLWDDDEKQEEFQAKLVSLAAKYKVFEVDGDVEQIRQCMQSLLQEKECHEDLSSMHGGASPLTVLEFDMEPVDGKKEDASVEQGVSLVSASQKTEACSSVASDNSIDCEVNPLKDVKKEPTISEDTEGSNAVDEVEVPGEGLVWETLEMSRTADPKKRPSCLDCLDIFDVKPKAIFRRVSETTI